MKTQALLPVLLAIMLCAAGCGQHQSDKTSPATDKATPATDKGNNPAPPAVTPFKLEGTWLGTSLEIDGQMIPDRKKPNITFTADGHYTCTLNEHQANEGTFKVDPAAKPKAIDLKGEKIAEDHAPGDTSLGIVEVNGDTLRLCLNLSPTAPRPTEFKSGKETFVWTLKAKPNLTAAEIEDLVCKQPIKMLNDLVDALEKAQI